MPEQIVTQITPPRVAFIDSRNGNVSREWYMFFLSLYKATSGSGASLEDLQKAPSPIDVMFPEINELQKDIQALQVAPIVPPTGFNVSGNPVYYGSATIDFGSSMVSDGTFVIVDAGITTLSKVQCFVMEDTTATNDADAHRHAGASWQFSTVAGSGQFTVNITNLIDLCSGQFKIGYAYQ